VLRFNKSLILN